MITSELSKTSWKNWTLSVSITFLTPSGVELNFYSIFAFYATKVPIIRLGFSGCTD